MKNYLVFATAVSFAALAPAAAQDGDATDAAAPQTEAATVPESEPEEAADPRDEEVVCRTERVTGSLTRRNRICMTRGEWAETERNTYQGVSEMQRGASGGQAVSNNRGAGGQ